MIKYRVIDRAQQDRPTAVDQITGRGVDFPFRFDPMGKIQLSSGIERIRDSIIQILLTGIGERLFNPEFGSRLPELAFEQYDPIFKQVLIRYTKDAIARWEPRVNLKNVEILDDPDNNAVLIRLTYELRNAPVEDTFVVPFKTEPMPTDDLYTGSEAYNMLNPGEIR